MTSAAAADGFPLQFSMVFNNDKDGFGILRNGGLFWFSILFVGRCSCGPVEIDKGEVVGIWLFESDSDTTGDEEGVIASIDCIFCSFSICCCVLEWKKSSVLRKIMILSLLIEHASSYGLE